MKVFCFSGQKDSERFLLQKGAFVTTIFFFCCCACIASFFIPFRDTITASAAKSAAILLLIYALWGYYHIVGEVRTDKDGMHLRKLVKTIVISWSSLGNISVTTLSTTGFTFIKLKPSSPRQKLPTQRFHVWYLPGAQREATAMHKMLAEIRTKIGE